MVIKVLGTGCSKCKSLYANALQAVKEMSIEAEVVKEEDMMKIMSYNVLQLPALVVDEKVVAKGTLSVKEVKTLLQKCNL